MKPKKLISGFALTCAIALATSVTGCSGDADMDGIADTIDNCPVDANFNQTDGDADGFGDVCDNCPEDSNPSQDDFDGDGQGDACDDGILDIQ